MKCKYCNQENDNQARFCVNCGQPIDWTGSSDYQTNGRNDRYDSENIPNYNAGQDIYDRGQNIYNHDPYYTRPLGQGVDDSDLIYNPEPEKKKTGRIIGIIVIVVFLCSFIALACLKGKDLLDLISKKEPDPTPTPVATATPIPTATPSPTPTPSPTATPSPTPTPDPAVEEAKIHRYEVIRDNCTWTQAYQNCLNRGGYLARITSAEEYRYVLGLIQGESSRNKLNVVYIGARRSVDPNQPKAPSEYHWIDENNQLINGTPIQQQNYMPWMNAGNQEPTYYCGSDIEEYLGLYNYRDQIYLNDIPNDTLSAGGSGFSGKIAYLCEYPS